MEISNELRRLVDPTVNVVVNIVSLINVKNGHTKKDLVILETMDL